MYLRPPPAPPAPVLDVGFNFLYFIETCVLLVVTYVVHVVIEYVGGGRGRGGGEGGVRVRVRGEGGPACQRCCGVAGIVKLWCCISSCLAVVLDSLLVHCGRGNPVQTRAPS